MDPPPQGEHQPSKSDLLASAKVVYEAGQAAMTQGADKVDKGAAAGAAADLLGAASEYGKLDEKGYGGYVDKAEGYLHKYASGGSGGTTAAPPPPPSDPVPPGGEKDEKPGAAGLGDVLKIAEGALKDKKEGESEGGGGGGAGGFLKMAGGFFK